MCPIYWVCSKFCSPFSETTKDHASRVGITFVLAQELRIK